MGDSQVELQRVTPAAPVSGLEIRLLTHKDLRVTTRIKIFMSFMADAIRQHSDLFWGKLAQAAPPHPSL